MKKADEFWRKLKKVIGDAKVNLKLSFPYGLSFILIL